MTTMPKVFDDFGGERAPIGESIDCQVAGLAVDVRWMWSLIVFLGAVVAVRVVSTYWLAWQVASLDVGARYQAERVERIEQRVEHVNERLDAPKGR